MAENKMTQKQMYAHIAELLADDVEVVEFCTLKIQQLDKRKNAPRKANPEVQQRREDIKNFLAGQENAIAVKDIADALGFSSPQVSGALRGLVTAGEVEVVEPEQKSKSKLYKIANSVEEF